MRKKGSEKYWIIVSLVLGLIVLGIFAFFIFQEYFGEEDIDWETCRQSVVMRNMVPESQRIITTSIEKIKEIFPLRCKTEVIEIDSSVEEEVYKEIADTMVKCWYIFGAGDYNIYPQGDYGGLMERKDCFVCARIIFSEKTKNKFSQGLDIGGYLISHDLDGNPIPESRWKSVKPDGKITGKSTEGSYAYYLRYVWGMNSLILPDSEQMESENYGMRQIVKPSDGDLLIGSYFYSNRETLKNWNFPGVQYRYSFPFYMQMMKDSFSECVMQGVPA